MLRARIRPWLLSLILCSALATIAPPASAQPIEARVGVTPDVAALGSGRFEVSRGLLLRYVQLEEAQSGWHAYADVLIQQSDANARLAEAHAVEVALWRSLHGEAVTSAQRIAEERRYWQDRAKAAERRGVLDRAFLPASALVVGGLVLLATNR